MTQRKRLVFLYCALSSPQQSWNIWPTQNLSDENTSMRT
jgi:hypothetical protein